MTVTEIPTGWQPAHNPSLADEMDGHLVALRPLRTEDRVTDDGTARPVTICDAWFIDADGFRQYNPEAPIAWSVVRQQLARSTPEAPWIVGRLKQKGRAFVMEPPRPDEVAQVQKRLDAVAQTIAKLVSEGARDVTGTPDAEEEPF